MSCSEENRFFFLKKDICLEDEDSFIDVDLQVEVEQSDGLPAGNLGGISLQTKQNWKNLEDWQTNLFVNLFPFIAVCYFRLTKQKESLTRNESWDQVQWRHASTFYWI